MSPAIPSWCSRSSRSPMPSRSSSSRRSTARSLSTASAATSRRAPTATSSVIGCDIAAAPLGPSRGARRASSLRLDRLGRQIARTEDLLRRELVAGDLDVLVDEVDGVLHAVHRDVAEAVLLDVRRDRDALEDLDLLDHDLRVERLH